MATEVKFEKQTKFLLINLVYDVYQFPRSAVTEYYKLGGLKKQKFIVAQSGGQKSEINVLAKLAPSEICRGIFPHLLLAADSLLAVFDFLWFINASYQSSVFSVFPCTSYIISSRSVSVSKPPP